MMIPSKADVAFTRIDRWEVGEPLLWPCLVLEGFGDEDEAENILVDRGLIERSDVDQLRQQIVTWIMYKQHKECLANHIPFCALVYLIGEIPERLVHPFLKFPCYLVFSPELLVATSDLPAGHRTAWSRRGRQTFNEAYLKAVSVMKQYSSGNSPRFEQKRGESPTVEEDFVSCSTSPMNQQVDVNMHQSSCRKRKIELLPPGNSSDSDDSTMDVLAAGDAICYDDNDNPGHAIVDVIAQVSGVLGEDSTLTMRNGHVLSGKTRIRPLYRLLDKHEYVNMPRGTTNKLSRFFLDESRNNILAEPGLADRLVKILREMHFPSTFNMHA